MVRIRQKHIRQVLGATAVAALLLGQWTTPASANLLDKAKEAARKAAAAVVDGAKKAAAAIAGAATKVAAILSPSSLARKVKEAATDFLKQFSRESGKTYFEYLPGKKAQLAQRNTLTIDGPAALNELPASVASRLAWYEQGDLKAAPPKVVDRRDSQSWVDDQGTRGTCVAFASMAAMEAKNGRHKLSKEYAYWLLKYKDQDAICKSDGATLSNAAWVLRQNGFPREIWYPYLPITAPAIKLCPMGPSGLAEKHATYRATEVVQIPRSGTDRGVTINNPRFIESVLAAGHEVVLAIDVAWKAYQSMAILPYRGVLDVIVDSKSGQPRTGEGSHAMLIVGYERTGDAGHGGGFFWVKNSWSMLVGHGGYMKLSYDYIRQYSNGAFFITGVRES